jgi:branched-chain amino acid aminotransferase
MMSDSSAAFADGAAYVDGEYVPVDEARVPILDTGLTRSDLTYDVVAIWNGAFFRLDDHLDRFARGCELLHLTLPYSRSEIGSVLAELARLSGLRESYVEVICSRGVPRRGSRDPRTYENRFYAYAIPYVWIHRDSDRVGMRAVITRSVARIPAKSVDPTVKNFHWGDLTRGLFEAYERDAKCPILLDYEGNVTEGPGYNLFALVDGRLLTPAEGVLQGITRKTVLELAAEEGIETEVRPVAAAEVLSASELFATSTAGGVMPITNLDGVDVGDGQIGPVTRLLYDRYWAAHDDPRFLTPIDYSAAAAVSAGR